MFGSLLLFLGCTFSEVYTYCPEQAQYGTLCDYGTRESPSYARTPERQPPYGSYVPFKAYLSPLAFLQTNERVTRFRLKFFLHCSLGPFDFKITVVEDDGLSWLDDYVTSTRGTSILSEHGHYAQGDIYHEFRGSEYGDFGHDYEFKTKLVHNCGGEQKVQVHMNDCDIDERCDISIAASLVSGEWDNSKGSGLLEHYPTIGLRGNDRSTPLTWANDQNPRFHDWKPKLFENVEETTSTWQNDQEPRIPEWHTTPGPTENDNKLR